MEILPCVLVALEAILNKFFPLGAKIIKWVIKILDAICEEGNEEKTIKEVMSSIS